MSKIIPTPAQPRNIAAICHTKSSDHLTQKEGLPLKYLGSETKKNLSFSLCKHRSSLTFHANN